jgi:hypothetical protein
MVATLGVATHTGWAALIVVSQKLEVVDRRAVRMIDGSDPDAPPFVFHAARGLGLAAAERFVREQAQLARGEAQAALVTMVAELRRRGHELIASGLIVGDGAPLPKLEKILASHALVHAAEGRLFRDAIKRASETLHIPVVEVGARQLERRAAARLGISLAKLPARLEAIGRSAGRPWAKDQKTAFLAAMLAAPSPSPTLA